MSSVCPARPGRQQTVFRGGSAAVRVFATVMDRDGRLVTTLTQDNFEVRDDGKPQPITQFDNSPRPIRLIVMLDVSGSMEGNLPLLRAAGAQLFARLGPDDVARVGAFGQRGRHQPVVHPRSRRARRGAAHGDLRRMRQHHSGTRSTRRWMRLATRMTGAT